MQVMDYILRKKDWVEVATEAYKVTELRKECERREKELLERLKELSKEKNSQGGGYKFTRFERKGTIDYAKIPQLKEINLEQYRKEPSFMWKLEFIGIELA